ncbi:MAG: cadherin-like beta sandwich domain-containing protein [Clostridia bacterium]|nr:cadherin-like beta sandwich domain-containing protein [Clostridia bacterium]
MRMKKIISVLTVLVLCLGLMLPMTISAATASASLTGPATVRAGDTITVSFNLNGSGIYGVEGMLSYDSSLVTLSGTSQKIASPWKVEFNGNKFAIYDDTVEKPINSNKTLFTATFKVKSVATGTNIKISCTGVTATDGSADKNIGTITYSKTVAEPLSTENKLESLTVDNATISPAFSANTTSYTASVPFSVSKLSVSAKAADSKAKVSINSPNLKAGGTTKVTVTVTAESGAKKTYTISVEREADPNYQASRNANLSNITVEGFLLSPVFNTDKTDYIVWTPYETTSVKVKGTASDKKASVEVVGGDYLAAGQDNTVKVICTAENGNKKEYIVIVKRAAGHDGSVDEAPKQDNTSTDTTNTPPETKTDITLVIIVGLIALIVGLAGGFVLGFALKKKKT